MTTEVADAVDQSVLHAFEKTNELSDEESALHDVQLSLPTTQGGMGLNKLAWLVDTATRGRARCKVRAKWPKQKKLWRTASPAGGPRSCGESASGNVTGLGGNCGDDIANDASVVRTETAESNSQMTREHREREVAMSG